MAQALAALAQRAAATGGTAPTTASLPSSGESFSSLGDLLDVEVPCAPSEAALYAELLVERLINLNRTSPGQVNAHAPAGVSRGKLKSIMATGGALELANAQACLR